MSGGDRQCVRAVGNVRLPRGLRRPRPGSTPGRAHRCRHHLADIPVVHAVAHLVEHWRTAGLQPERVDHSLRLRQVAHLDGLRQIGPQRPFTEHVLLGAQGQRITSE